MSNKISRRAFLKCAGVSAAAVGSASLLSGCKTNGSNTTVNDVKVGDTVKNWNGLGGLLVQRFLQALCGSTVFADTVFQIFKGVNAVCPEIVESLIHLL